MPTVLRVGAPQVTIYPNDHRPAHVHVIGDGHEAVFQLNCPAGPVTIRENYGFPARDVSRILSELLKNLAVLCNAWEYIHGTR
jgi:hypothetical protein